MRNKDFSGLLVLVLRYIRLEICPTFPYCTVLWAVNYSYPRDCKIRSQLLSEEIKSLSNHPFSKTGVLDPLIEKD